MRGFEPPISRPPDAHFNRTKLHPVFFQCGEYNEYNLTTAEHLTQKYHKIDIRSVLQD